MKVDVLLGLQWGDEGKGKIVDVLTPEYDVIARFQGGPNAGHSLEFGKIKHVLHSIPSGIFHKGQINVVGNGVVIDPIIFKKEIEEIRELDVDLHKTLLISKKAHLILPTHRILDAASEIAKGKTKIGSTLKGIGPTYMDKTGRNGLRVGDIIMPGFRDKYEFLKEKHKDILKQYNYSYSIDEIENEWFEGIKCLKEYELVESEYLLNGFLNENKSVLAEGAQGTLLDIDFGSYPFVTSSNTICAGACSGLGIAPGKIGDVIGIFKAYCTRVGSGPFPTELTDKTGNELREKGKEFGATTGRPRRCGWLDLTALKYSIMLNGVTRLIMTKADVLSGFEKLKICTSYNTSDGKTDIFPFTFDESIQPEYIELPAWSRDISEMSNIEELPKELLDYISYIEDEVQVPVTIASVGPSRKATIHLK